MLPTKANTLPFRGQDPQKDPVPTIPHLEMAGNAKKLQNEFDWRFAVLQKHNSEIEKHCLDSDRAQCDINSQDGAGETALIVKGEVGEGGQLPRDTGKSSLLTTYWSKSISSSKWFGGPASRHGTLNPLFQVALYLPS